jgi:hypothetical protein
VKVCSICGIEKPATEFTVVNRKEGYRRRQCKPCWSGIVRQRRSLESPTQREIRRNRNRISYHRMVARLITANEG